MILNQKNRIPIAVSCLFGLIAAWFSVGYFHLDEHYQILEFLSFKLGNGKLNNLPWEFQAKIRPWIQPFFYYGVSKFFDIFGIESPYFLERFFRFISMILFQLSIWKMTLYFVEKYQLDEKLSQFLTWSTSLFWVFPFLSARISSEGVGGSLFFLGLVGVLKALDESGEKKIVSIFLNSILIGLAVWIRFQLGAAVLGFLIWYIAFSQKFNLKFFLSIAAGGIFAALVGIGIDFWGYGEFVITPFKYFSRNILEGEAARHGVTPWWEYFYISQKKMHPGFGLFVVFCFVFQWVRNFKDVFVLSMIAFFLLHIGTSHKELRFIFPMAMLIPINIVLFLRDIKIREKAPAKLLQGMGGLFFIYLFLGSIISATRIQHQGVGAIKYLQDNNISKTYYFSGIPIKSMTHNVIQSYYGKNITEEVAAKKFEDINESKAFYVSGRGGKQALLFQQQKCIEVFPNFNKLYFWMHYSRKFYKQDFYSIYKCQ
jgi:phosphatidylinositol glycan class B